MTPPTEPDLPPDEELIQEQREISDLEVVNLEGEAKREIDDSELDDLEREAE
jgi:hypothetical protein